MEASKRKGFTLIELLIVIAIIAVLAVVVILSLNPAELLRQARDSNRLSDMSTLKSAIALYLADSATPQLGSPGTCYISAPDTTFNSVSSSGIWNTGATTCADWSTLATTTVSATTSDAINSSGWIPVDFSQISSGSPIGQEPVDAVDSTGTLTCVTGDPPSGISGCSLFYSYIPYGTVFKLTAFMESAKYAHGGTGDVTTNDGGNNPYVFEGGTNTTL